MCAYTYGRLFNSSGQSCRTNNTNGTQTDTMAKNAATTRFNFLTSIFLNTHSKMLEWAHGWDFLGHGENVDGVLIVFVRYKSSCCSCCCWWWCWTGFCGQTLLYKFKVTAPHNKDRRDYLKGVQIISSICNESKIVQYHNLFKFVE